MTAWTKDQDDYLRKLIGEGKTWDDIALRLQRTKKSAYAHWKQLTRTPERRDELQHKRTMRKREIHGHEGKPPRIPPELWTDRDARFSEPRSITGFVLGDPPPSRSALAQRQVQP